MRLVPLLEGPDPIEEVTDPFLEGRDALRRRWLARAWPVLAQHFEGHGQRTNRNEEGE